MKRVKSKLITTLLAVTMAFSLTACGISQDNLDSAVTPLSEQITTINATLTEMQTLDTTLDGYIDTLESKVTTLETDLTAVNATLESLEENSATKTALTETKTALESEINTIKADITALKAKDTELDDKITALQTALSTEITDTETWIEETFATKTACDTLKTEINASLATLQTKIDGLEDCIDNLETTVNGLQQDIKDLENALNDLQIRVNCLEGKHVINEAKTISYTYTWSETAPISTCDYVCLHCEKEVKNEAILPSVWSVGDKVTYVAKDGNSYVSTVGEVTDNKAVLVSDDGFSKTATLTNEEQFLALLEPVGARYPYSNETVYAEIIKPWLLTTLKSSTNSSLSYYYSVDYSKYWLLKCATQAIYEGSVHVGSEKVIKNWSEGYYKYESTYHYRYIWDIEFSTAE